MRKFFLFGLLIFLGFFLLPSLRADAIFCVKSGSSDCKDVAADSSGGCPFDTYSCTPTDPATAAQTTASAGQYNCTCPKSGSLNEKKSGPYSFDSLQECNNTCITSCKDDGYTNGICSKADQTNTDTLSPLKSLASQQLNPAGFGDVSGFVGIIIKFLMGVMGTIAFALYVWAGFSWMTAAGNPERVGKAKTILLWTSLGVAVILASYVLVSFVFQNLGTTPAK